MGASKVERAVGQKIATHAFGSRAPCDRLIDRPPKATSNASCNACGKLSIPRNLTRQWRHASRLLREDRFRTRRAEHW